MSVLERRLAFPGGYALEVRFDEDGLAVLRDDDAHIASLLMEKGRVFTMPGDVEISSSEDLAKAEIPCPTCHMLRFAHGILPEWGAGAARVDQWGIARDEECPFCQCGLLEVGREVEIRREHGARVVIDASKWVWGTDHFQAYAFDTPEALGRTGQQWTDAEIEEALRAEVADLHAVLEGESYFYRLLGPDGEELEGCGGYAGVDALRHCAEEGRSALSSWVPMGVEGQEVGEHEWPSIWGEEAIE